MGRGSRWLFGMLVAAMALLVVAGLWFYATVRRQMHQDAEAALAVVAELKVNEIAKWRAERLADAGAMVDGPLLGKVAAEWLGSGEEGARQDILRRFRSLQRHYRYSDIMLTDASGEVKLSLTGRTDPLHAESLGALRASLTSGRPVLTDLHVGPAGLGPHTGTVAPLFVGEGASRRPAGAVVFVSDAEMFLYPLVQSWPTMSQTAETLLVRRDGDSVLFLNELRHQGGAALKLRIPMAQWDLPAGIAGKGEGVVEGRDYRGKAVLAVLKAVPNSPWFMVSKIDEDEALSAWHRESFVLMVGLLALVGMGTAAGGMVWQRGRKAHYRALFESEAALRQSEQRYRTTLLSIGDGVVTTDAEGRVELLNPVAERLTGWPLAEARGRPVEEVFRIVNEDSGETVENPVRRVVREGLVVGLANHTLLLSRDGREHPIADSGAPIRGDDEGVAGAVLVFRDVTEARRMDHERDATIRLLQLLNARNDLRGLMQSVTAFLQAWSGCDAVGIRLRDGDDFPYYETRGFPPEFVLAEDELCVRTEEGEAVLDEVGDPVHACMCGNVLSGRFDAEKPFFSARGSFWTNSTTELLASATEADRQGRTRNRCNGEGYESVALVALRSEGRPLGLLQLNDRRPGQFSAEKIALLERLADSLALALSQRRAQTALHESEQRHRTTLYSIGDAVITTDTQGLVTQMNGVAEELTGWPQGEASGRPVEEVFRIVNEDTGATVESPVARVLREGMVVGLANHTILISRDGTERPVADSGAPVHDDRGNMSGVVLVFRDQTRERSVQREMETERENLKAIMAASPAGLMVLDESEQVTQANPAAERMFGRRVGELRHRRCGELISCVNRHDSPEGCGHGRRCPQCEVRRSVRAVLAGGEAIHGREAEATLEDGGRASARWLSFSVAPVVLAGRRHVIVSLDDVTGRRRLEEERARLATVLEASPDFVAYSDARDLRVLYVNRAGRRLLGLGEAADLSQMNVLDGLSAESREMHEKVIFPTVRSEGMWTGETTLRHRDGHDIPVWTVALALKGSSGEVEYLATVSRDLTDLRRVEAQLLQSQKMEAVGQLAGGVAHDFRNQLTVIKGFGEMLQRQSLVKEEGVEMLEQVLKAADRSARLTGQLLAFSRKDMLRPRLADLTDLVSDIAKPLARMIGEDVRLQVIPSGTRCSVSVDAGQFQQALVNLATNARDAMPQGGTLTVETWVSSPEEGDAPKSGSYAVVSVSDTGCGMDRETLSRVFEPFYTTKEVGQGTGLGLAMVYGFVTQSGGWIEAESKPGHGSAFRLYFPLVEGAGTAAERPRVSRPLPRGTETILVVEDEPAVRKMIAASLAECGYTVLDAGGAAEACAIYEREGERIDMLIADVVMPETSGVDLVRRLREMEARFPTLLMSGYAENELSRRDVDVDRSALLVKPFTQEELATKVRQMLDSVKRTRAGA